MKVFKNYLPVLTLVLALVVAFAFSAKEKKTESLTVVWFQYVGPVDPDPNDAYDPDNWDELTSSPSCLGEGTLCAIGVDPTEIYTSGPFVGRPMVDDNDTDAYDALDDAWHSSGQGSWWNATIGTAIVETKQP
jgi:hypothetical protein